MTKLATLPMDSYGLAAYSVPVPCYICEGGNNFDAELCRHCQAPLALTYQANAKKRRRPKLVAAIGPPSAGKTVYLGLLADALSRQHSGLQLLARGAFSVTLQQKAVEALSRCRFPQPTPSEPEFWHWLYCQVKKGRRPVELIMPDISGEALIEEIDHPNRYLVVRAFLARCAGVLLMVDATPHDDGEQIEDFLAMKIVSYLLELGSRKNSWAKRPVAVVFTKADQNESCFEDVEQFARKYTPGLWRQCRDRLRRHQFFATSVAGACATQLELGGRVQVPLRVEPRGIIEPFEWLMGSIAR